MKKKTTWIDLNPFTEIFHMQVKIIWIDSLLSSLRQQDFHVENQEKLVEQVWVWKQLKS